jgi:uncharacterized protein YndB with AHSA1/START domain
MTTYNPDHDFVITRVFSAPRDLVFKAWTEPEHMARWWGPRICTCPVCEMDVRPGGAYRIVMRMPDTVEYPVTGIFREVVKPERIVMTLDCTGHPAAWHDLVKPNREKADVNPAGILVATVTFDETDGWTKLTVRIRFDSVEIRDAMLKMGMNEGWSQSLDRLQENLAAAKSESNACREIVTTRIFDAPRELVWKAWTEPEHIKQWWGPNGFTNTIHIMDVRPGGRWSHVMHGPDGTDYKNESVYREIVKPERIVYDHVSGPTHRTTATFEEQDGKTKVTLHILFGTAAQRDKVAKEFGAVEGAKQTLGRLGDHLAKM